MAQVASRILDPKTGQPIVKEVMTQRLAEATITGVRQAVGMAVTGGLSPQDLASVLRGAEDGDPERYLQLAEEIEEKEPHYLSVLGTRKRQVSQLDMTISASSENDAQSKKIADWAQEQFLDSGLIDDALFDILDAVGKGFSLSEIIWDIEGASWNITALEYVDPRFVRFDRATRRVPLLRADNDGGIGLPLPPYKFVFQQIKAKSGLPIRAGLARPAAWAWMFKNFAVKDWVQFCEIYGMPWRVGSYPPGATQDDKDELLRAVSSLSSDAAAIKPANMLIEFQDASGKASGGVHEGLARFMDEQLSKLVLGQTGTTDATPGKLGGQEDHSKVREDIERADAKALMACLNRQLVRPGVDLNFGPQVKYPWLWIGRPEPKNAKLMVDTAALLVPRGLKVRAADLRAATGFDEPQDGDEVLTAPAGGAAPTSSVPNNDLQVNLSHLSAQVALLAAEIRGDAIDRAAKDQLANWEPLMEPIEKELQTAFMAATSYEDLRKRLTAIAPDLPTSALAERIARMAFQSFAAGRLGQPLKTS